jgi:hypothetical protein
MEFSLVLVNKRVSMTMNGKASTSGLRGKQCHALGCYPHISFYRDSGHVLQKPSYRVAAL